MPGNIGRRQLFAEPSEINELAEKLNELELIRRFDVDDNIEAGTLAHAFSDMETSFVKLLDELFPKLKCELPSEAEVLDTMHEIGEELRHILYHIRDCRFYGYLNDRGTCRQRGLATHTFNPISV